MAIRIGNRRLLTGPEEMLQRYPVRPYINRPTYELNNMRLALSMMRYLNTAEEEQRLADVTRELRLRRRGGR